jgi:signal transduction histidine kinase
MRLLQVTVRSLLIYAIVLVLISIPVSLVSVRAILNEEVDETIAHQADQFLRHIKGFEYLDDLATDLEVLDKLSNNIHIKPSDDEVIENGFITIYRYDSLEREEKPFRQMSSSVLIKGRPYILTVEMSLIDNDDLVMTIGLVELALSVLLAAGLLILNRSLSQRLWKPFYNMLDQLKAYHLDRSEPVKMEDTGIIEFDDLNKTVAHLIERNRKVFLQQKEFIENASHELQTPIAVFQSKLDRLMQSPTLSQGEAEVILELESTAKRMAKLNKNLLLLSKIDNEQYHDKEEIEVDSIIANQLSILKPLVSTDNIKIVTTTKPFTLRANRTLIEILVSNLLHNAVRYSPKEKEIDVTLSDRTLRVSNNGDPLKMDIQTMTARFSKESTDPNSTGLGLAIVKKICDTCHYHLQYAYHNGAHVFEVTF